MGGTINDVKTNVNSIVTGLATYGTISTGAGSYKDFPTSPWGSAGDYPYKNDASIDGLASTQAGINTWGASGGNDTPEANLYALTQAAGAAPGWRSGSEKFVLWFGDATGHVPTDSGGTYPGPSTADTITALQNAGVTVLAFNMGNLDGSGQATAITSATGGTLYSGFGSNVVTTIVNAIGSGFSNYTTVGIDSAAVPAGLGISVVPVSYSGSYDRSVDRTFTFDVTFTGLAAGTYAFDLYGTVDGGRIATEGDVITVGDVSAIPEPSSLLLMGTGLVGLFAFGRKKFGKK